MNKIIVVLLLIVLLFGFVGIVDAKSDKANENSAGYGDSSESDDDSEDSDTLKGTSDEDEDDSDEDEDDSDEDEDDSDEDDDDSDEDDEDDEDGSGKGNEEKTIVKSENTYTFVDANQNQYQVTIRTEEKTKNGETFQKIKVRGFEAVSDLEIEEETENGEVKIKAKMSNGNRNEIKIMPDTASETALEKLKTKKGLEIQLKEVGEGNNLSVVYDIEGDRTTKLLGLFKVTAELRARVDAETGELLEFETPWWYFLVGKEVLVPECDADNLNLCEAQEECEKFGIWFGDACISACPEDALVCDDGSSVSRNESLSCEFNACPIVIETPGNETNSETPTNETNQSI